MLAGHDINHTMQIKERLSKSAIPQDPTALKRRAAATPAWCRSLPGDGDTPPIDKGRTLVHKQRIVRQRAIDLDEDGSRGLLR